VESFAEQLARLIADEPLRRALAAGARATALSRDWDAVFDRLLDDYQATIDAHGRRRLAA
jgi:glycosyltransferase involved in cell wall biosynthesis